MKKTAIIIAFCFWTVSHLHAAKSLPDQIHNLRFAIGHHIVGIYDIPFSAYYKLGMWDEIQLIFESNNSNILEYEFPGEYYSRPFVMDDRVWVFENAGKLRGRAFIFQAETLTPIKERFNEKFSRIDGGVRRVYRNTVLSGGSDRDVDAMVLWDTDTDNIDILQLQNGHYITSIFVGDGTIFAGACGGKINSWDFESREYRGSYSTNSVRNNTWNTFNRKECISNLFVSDDKLYGAGGKTIYKWGIEGKTLLGSYKKRIPNSMTLIHPPFLVEFKNELVIVRNLHSGRVLYKIHADRAIQDVIITSDKILPGFRGDMLILSMKYNKGIQFHNLETSKKLALIDIPGQSLTVYRHRLLAAADNRLYRYSMSWIDPEKYAVFLNQMNAGAEISDTVHFEKLIQIAETYPKVELSPLIRRYFDSHAVTFNTKFQYEKQAVSPKESEDKQSIRKSTQKINVVYSLENRSENHYLIDLSFKWIHGSAQADSVSFNVSGSDKTYVLSKDRFHHFNSYSRSILIPPNGGSFSDRFSLNETQPSIFRACPVKLKVVPEKYYEEFMNAINGNTSDIDMIDSFIADPDLKSWLRELLEIRKALDKKTITGSLMNQEVERFFSFLASLSSAR